MHQNLQLLLYKRAYEKNAYKLHTENICKPCTWQRISIQNKRKTQNATLKNTHTHPKFNWKIGNQHKQFAEQNIQMANRHMKRCYQLLGKFKLKHELLLYTCQND